MSVVAIARLLFLCYVAIIGYSIYRAVTGRPRWYWVAAILVYIMSTAFAMSIGGFTVAAAFALAAVALVHTVRATPRFVDTLLAVMIALLAWGVWARFGNITWVFWPLLQPLEKLFGE